MTVAPVPAEGEDDLRLMQSILSDSIAAGGTRYTIHPGDLAWWIHHADPREDDKYWLWDDWGFAAVDTRHQTVDLFARPTENRAPMIDWAQTQRKTKDEERPEIKEAPREPWPKPQPSRDFQSK